MLIINISDIIKQDNYRNNNKVILFFTRKSETAEKYNFGSRKIDEGPLHFYLAFKQYIDTNRATLLRENIDDYNIFTAAINYPGIILAIDIKNFPKLNNDELGDLDDSEYIINFNISPDKLYIRITKNKYVLLKSSDGQNHINYLIYNFINETKINNLRSGENNDLVNKLEKQLKQGKIEEEKLKNEEEHLVQEKAKEEKKRAIQNLELFILGQKEKQEAKQKALEAKQKEEEEEESKRLKKEKEEKQALESKRLKEEEAKQKEEQEAKQKALEAKQKEEEEEEQEAKRLKEEQAKQKALEAKQKEEKEEKQALESKRLEKEEEKQALESKRLKEEEEAKLLKKKEEKKEEKKEGKKAPEQKTSQKPVLQEKHSLQYKTQEEETNKINLLVTNHYNAEEHNTKKNTTQKNIIPQQIVINTTYEKGLNNRLYQIPQDILTLIKQLTEANNIEIKSLPYDKQIIILDRYRIDSNNEEFHLLNMLNPNIDELNKILNIKYLKYLNILEFKNKLRNV